MNTNLKLLSALTAVTITQFIAPVSMADLDSENANHRSQLSKSVEIFNQTGNNQHNPLAYSVQLQKTEVGDKQKCSYQGLVKFSNDLNVILSNLKNEKNAAKLYKIARDTLEALERKAEFQKVRNKMLEVTKETLKEMKELREKKAAIRKLKHEMSELNVQVYTQNLKRQRAK